MKTRTKPFIVVAVVALSVAAGAVAATSGSTGVIRACANKSTGALRLLSGANCGSSERLVSWNKRGRNGATNLTTRSGMGTINQSCSVIFGSSYTCGGTQTSTVPCHRGERATGGGYGKASGSTGVMTVSESRPNPTTGTPTGWTVTASISTVSSSSPTAPPAHYPIYVVCASP